MARGGRKSGRTRTSRKQSATHTDKYARQSEQAQAQRQAFNTQYDQRRKREAEERKAAATQQEVLRQQHHEAALYEQWRDFLT